MQDGRTPLIRACINKDEVMAALLMEPTKEAGALDAPDYLPKPITPLTGALDAQVTEQAWGAVSGVMGAGR